MGGIDMNLKKILLPAAGLAAALALTGCVTPYASGTVGSRIGNGGYVSGSIGGAYPYGGYGSYGGYGQAARVYGYDRYGNPLYRLPDGRIVQGYDPYRGGYSYPGYGYGYPGSYYGYPGYGYSHPYPRHPVVRPPRGHDGGGSTPVRPPTVRPVPGPDTRGGSPLGNVVRGVREAERQRNVTPVRRSDTAVQEQ